MIPLQGQSQIITRDEKLDVYREGVVQYVDGKPVKSRIAEFDIICNVQPLNGRQLLLVPEGDRDKEQYYCFTNNIQKLVKKNDRVVRDGVNFQVQEVEHWGSYSKIRIMRDDVGPNKSP